MQQGRDIISRHRIHVPKPPPSREPWIAFPIVIGTVGFTVIVALGPLMDSLSDRPYATALGTVLETRLVVDRIGEGYYGSSAYYRIEARVRFLQKSQVQERWLVAPQMDSKRDLLLIKLAGQPKSCLVYWPPEHPENAKCDLK
jgi:hypothetical protein